MPASGAARPRSAGRSTLDPERIAHGPGAIDDPDLCRELIARGVTLDLCPSSNWQAGIVPSIAAHPLARLHRLGVSGHPLDRRHDRVGPLADRRVRARRSTRSGSRPTSSGAIDRHALDVAFADEATLGRLRAEFDAWSEPDQA